jgi:hypothetical protein
MESVIKFLQVFLELFILPCPYEVNRIQQENSFRTKINMLTKNNLLMNHQEK